MHDDRAYTLAMLGWYLSERRIEHVKKKKRDLGSTKQILDKLVVSNGKHIDKIFG